jgi:hypothetical protein
MRCRCNATTLTEDNTMPARETNNAGRKYDELHRLRLIITITKNDATADVLRRMSQGTICVYKTLLEGIEAQNAFHNDAALVIKSSGEFASYGLSALVDERDGNVHNARHL